ncbi:putative membrane protein [Pseudonocardia thermophila]|uniref:Putative membrane protein n=1 Tax=Pseudonocardia thermophila TaxID=1848 RepID=A0A1M6V2U5_PSETH|nr:hypothetical protein [Pseudonocardia thermophila]SHK75744.1 putative membrane protein [Pseudonocardia thermophila]
MVWWHGPAMGGWGWALMVLAGVLLFAPVAAGLIVVARGAGGTREQDVEPGAADAPEEILARRFACGDIDADEYRERLAVLQAAGSRKDDS